ncbi:uncharacterized protein LOC100839203 [Brachypodium distachyon]|uniref:DUF4228 domain-containing protein n=1 Tax=Brachypodium distachyon TaxID=15368 RepID=I1HJX5_BRADI|nr:uncharacterized protein LOC100839203 [Brachypodium distachyon]KQK06525.1 hypothetical protein BRADI_2g26817v3 [Brachypodium distachyon]|eukprot:XP_003568550.1 uncharacterized protein LOC100839203 [Brachypodium distachyon]
MGNGLSPCLCSPAVHGEEEADARLVFWGGPTRPAAASGPRRPRPTTAGDVTAEAPGHLVCCGESFFIGLPVPALPPGEPLLAGRTYFVLPAARFPCRQPLTAASLASLSPVPAKVSLAGGGPSPFEYVAGDDGMALIRVLPEFIEKAITCGGKSAAAAAGQLCSTPELRKHYMQLVGTRQQRPWSPGLETISEARKRRGMPSPVRLVGLARASR